MTKTVIWQNGRWLIKGGVKYPFANPTQWSPYSKLNESLGLSSDIYATDEEMNILPSGTWDANNQPNPYQAEQDRQEGERYIQELAREAETSQETMAKTISDFPANTPTEVLIEKGSNLQDSYAPGSTVSPGSYDPQGSTTTSTSPTGETPTVTPPSTTVPTEATPVLTPEQSVEDMIKKAVDAVTGLIKEPPKPYEEVNPFYFDELLAKEAATAEYTPYYQEMLQDYTSKVEKNKARSQEDLTKTLDYLSGSKEYYTGKERELLDKALRTTNEGYAGQNLFFSGAKEKDIQELKKESSEQVGEYMRGYEHQTTTAKTTTERTLADLQEEQRQKERDVQREQETAIEGGVSQRKQETLDEYLAGMRKYYQNYPTYTNYEATATV